MTKLTEDMVVARSKGSDLHNVRKLNCWGSELSDVSVVRKLPNVEVLSLSVNNIRTLADFQYCPHLQELYIRKNSISDINEVLYLRNLPKLKSLWLADNPCANFEQYRQTVLRALPHLQKLDNIAVDSEEVQQAMVCGVPLPMTDSPMGQREECEMPRSSSIGESLRSEGGGSSMSDCSPPASERRYSQATTPIRSTHQESYGRSLDDGYEYEEEEEQPVMRRTSYSQSADPERRISQMSQYSNEGSYPQVSSGYGSNSSSSNGYYRDSDASERLHRTSYSSAQSPTRRSSQIVAEADSSADSRGYIRNHASEYDTRNANYLSREDGSARYNTSTSTTPTSNLILTPDSNNDNNTNNNVVCPLHRRTSQEQQYRDQQRWCETDERERGYSRGDGYGYASPPEVRQSPVGYEQRSAASDPRYEHQTQARTSENNSAVQQHYESAHRRAEQQMQNATSSAGERTSPTKPYPARPKTRNANLLSAVLCLVKELDYSSLEVVEMAVRCRMEELDD
ncbi:uncharacterized protein [Macrobrachium rosenbergii]|uniref:uncharacterized protein isoform X2 n=1 Tax=Macrobrachium rosenbergii TaxID=79674 RepID=UPI0034D6A00A